MSKEAWTYAVKKIFEGANSLGLSAKTPELAVQLTYAFYKDFNNTNDEVLYLIITACLSLAAKFIDSSEIDLESIRTVFDRLLSTNDLGIAEVVVLQKLEFNINRPTASDALESLKLGRIPDSSKLFIIKAYEHTEMLHKGPEYIAASSLSVSR